MTAEIIKHPMADVLTKAADHVVLSPKEIAAARMSDLLAVASALCRMAEYAPLVIAYARVESTPREGMESGVLQWNAVVRRVLSDLAIADARVQSALANQHASASREYDVAIPYPER